MVDVLYQGRFVNLVSRDGWEYATRPGCPGIVAVVAVTRDREVVLIEQFRIPLDAWVVEIPAGLVDRLPSGEPEPFESAVKRELLEETGYGASMVQHRFDGPPSAGISDEVITFFEARDVERVAAGGGVGSERIKTRAIPLDQVDSWLQSRVQQGYVIDPKVYTGLYLLRSAVAPGPGCDQARP